MGNVRYIGYPDMLSGTWTASSEDSSYPVSNLAVYSNLRRRYKALVSGAIVNVTLDTGVGNTISGLAAVPGIFIDWSNFASIKIQGNSVTTDWTTPPWNQAATLTKERWTGRRKGFWKLSELNAAAFAYRYLNVQIQNQASDDGAAYFLSRVVIGSLTELTVNFAYEPRRKAPQAVGILTRLDGSSQITQLGEPLMMVTMPRITRDTTSLNEQLDLERVSVDPFVFWDAGLGSSTESAWLMQRADPTELSQRFDTMHNSSMAFQEVG